MANSGTRVMRVCLSRVLQRAIPNPSVRQLPGAANCRHPTPTAALRAGVLLLFIGIDDAVKGLSTELGGEVLSPWFIF